MFEALLKLIRELYPHEREIPLHAPVLDQYDRAGVLEALDSGFVSSVGPHVPKFEEELARFTGAKKAVAVVNGTAALHLGLLVSGVRPGDAVLTQALTFVATANAISYAGAKPVFLDSDEHSLGLSPEAVERFLKLHAVQRDGGAYLKTGQRISACVPMHVFGHPVRLLELLALCDDWGIPVIEDAAEALGSELNGKKLGTIAPVGVLSFNGNKIITTGGGGALLFQNEELALKAKHLATTAKQTHSWEFYHDEVGFNYRMPNLNAALGCAQLKRLPEFLEKKQLLALAYEKFFRSQVATVRFVEAQAGCKPNWWLNAVLVENRVTRDQWLKDANTQGIMMRPVWELMSQLPMYANCQRDELLVARDLADRLVNLPSGVPT